MTAFDQEGDAFWWNSQAGSLEAARFAVWSVDPAEYDATTEACLSVINRYLLGVVGRPASLLDVGCGIGRLTIPQAERYPQAQVVGLDVAERMLTLAADEASGRVENVRWVHGDGVTAPEGSYDGAWTVVVLQHNNRRVCAALIASVAERLAPGGRFVYQLVDDSAFEDEAHVPEAVATEWATDAGLTVTDVVHGEVFPDWLWIVAAKP